MLNFIAIRFTRPLSASFGSVIAAVRSALHWYGAQMIKHGELLRQTGGAPI